MVSSPIGFLLANIQRCMLGAAHHDSLESCPFWHVVHELLAGNDSANHTSCYAVPQASGYGPLKGGYAMKCSTALARSLLAQPPSPILSALGATLQFEIAIGQNGRVWVNAAKPATVILIANAIERSEYLCAAQSKMLVEKLIARTDA